MNMCPGLCVSMNGGLEASATACGVTPHAQNTGTSPGRNGCASPHSGFVTSLIPMAAGSPMCTGAPCALGKRALAVTALRSEEHTSELQSQSNLVCRLLLEKKKNKKYTTVVYIIREQ